MKKEVKEEPKKKKEIIAEEKTEAKELHLAPEKQGKLKKASKFVYIMTKIARIFVIIGIVCLFLAMIFIPICTSNIKVEEGYEAKAFEIFGHRIEYSRTDSKIILIDPDDPNENQEITAETDVASLNDVFDFIENNDLTKLTVYSEIVMCMAVGLLVITAMILKRVYLFFKNINREKTPFILENIELLRSIMKLLIVSVVVSLVFNFVASLLMESAISIHIDLTGIVEIVMVYVVILIFEYGNKLQLATKGKIYSNYD